MRQVHTAGEKLFVDYSGKTPEIVDQATGAVRAVELFVAVLGASNYTYAEATETQRSADFIQSHTHAVEFLTGVPALIVPDQLKPGVRDFCRYEPILQRTYAEWAAHYQTAILPARPAKPRDKAKAEVGVQVAQRWILARLRHETFFSLAALNARIRELIDLNARPMKATAACLAATCLSGSIGPRSVRYPPNARVRRVAPSPREHRLPCRGRSPSVLRAVSPDPPDAGRAVVGDHRRSLSAGYASGCIAAAQRNLRSGLRALAFFRHADSRRRLDAAPRRCGLNRRRCRRAPPTRLVFVDGRKPPMHGKTSPTRRRPCAW
jgi:hypothetical protein